MNKRDGVIDMSEWARRQMYVKGKNNNKEELPESPEHCILNTLGGRCFITGACEINLKMKNCPKGYKHLYMEEEL